MKYFIIIAIAALAGCYSQEPVKTGLEGKIMPSFKLLLADSITLLDTKDIPTGKPIVLFYNSPHCPYCRSQMEEIVSDMEKLKDIQFYLITRYPLSEMKHIYDEYKLSKYQNIIIGRDTAGFLANYFEVSGVPFLAVYGKNKNLNEAFLGKIQSSQIKKAAFN